MSTERTSSILVVDDTPANLRVLSAMLEEHGFRVRPALNGRVALQAARREPPDLILLDINMPEMNGYEVCRELKQDEELSDIPVIFISALTETDDKLSAFEAGGVDYITKPFQFAEVEARVHTHLRLRRLQLETEENLRRLAELEEAKDSLVHLIVHDLRAPLSGQLLVLQLYEGAASEEERAEHVSTAIDSARIMSDMVSGLLDIHKIEAGEMPLDRREHDVADAIERALHTLGGLTAEHEIEVEVEGPMRASIDMDVIRRTIANFVSNAVRYTPLGGRIVVRGRAVGDDVRVEVEDTGRGIPPEHRERIFEKFAQVEARQQGGMRSTGLGLTFCKLAVESHGGAIGVESEVDSGSTFWFTLPGARPTE